MVKIQDIKVHMIIERYNYALANPEKFEDIKGIDVMEKVAESLGVSRNTVYRYLRTHRKKKYGSRDIIEYSFDQRLSKLISDFKRS